MVINKSSQVLLQLVVVLAFLFTIELVATSSTIDGTLTVKTLIVYLLKVKELTGVQNGIDHFEVNILLVNYGCQQIFD